MESTACRSVFHRGAIAEITPASKRGHTRGHVVRKHGRRVLGAAIARCCYAFGVDRFHPSRYGCRDSRRSLDDLRRSSTQRVYLERNSMPTKSSRHASASASDNGMLAPLNMISGVTRQQLSLMAEAACAVLGSSEALGKIQQHAVHQASIRHRAAAAALRGEVEPAEVLSLESELLRQDMQETAQYWAQLTSATIKGQLDMMGRMADALNSQSFSSAMDAWRSAVANAGERAEMH